MDMMSAADLDQHTADHGEGFHVDPQSSRDHELDDIIVRLMRLSERIRRQRSEWYEG
jgi:hypothetical protein